MKKRLKHRFLKKVKKVKQKVKSAKKSIARFQKKTRKKIKTVRKKQQKKVVKKRQQKQVGKPKAGLKQPKAGQGRLDRAFIDFKAQLTPGPLWKFLGGDVFKKIKSKAEALVKFMKKVHREAKKWARKIGIKFLSCEEEAQRVYERDAAEAAAAASDSLVLGASDAVATQWGGRRRRRWNPIKSIRKVAKSAVKVVKKGVKVIKKGVSAALNFAKKMFNKIKKKFTDAARAAKGLVQFLAAIPKYGFKGIFKICGAGFGARLSKKEVSARLEFQLLLFGQRSHHKFMVHFLDPARTVRDNFKAIKNLIFAIFRGGKGKGRDRCKFNFLDMPKAKVTKPKLVAIVSPAGVKDQQPKSPPKSQWNNSGNVESRKQVKKMAKKAQMQLDTQEEKKEQAQVTRVIRKQFRTKSVKTPPKATDIDSGKGVKKSAEKELRQLVKQEKKEERLQLKHSSIKKKKRIKKKERKELKRLDGFIEKRFEKSKKEQKQVKRSVIKKELKYMKIAQNCKRTIATCERNTHRLRKCNKRMKTLKAGVKSLHRSIHIPAGDATKRRKRHDDVVRIQQNQRGEDKKPSTETSRPSRDWKHKFAQDFMKQHQGNQGKGHATDGQNNSMKSKSSNQVNTSTGWKNAFAKDFMKQHQGNQGKSQNSNELRSQISELETRLELLRSQLSLAGA